MRSRSTRLIAAGVATLFAVVSMLAGGMVVLENIGGTYLVQIVPSDPSGPWWNYPQLVAFLPWGYAVLPMLPSVAMLLVSVGIGVGVAVGVTAVAAGLRPRGGESLHRADRAGAAAGVGPTVAGLATLGACCCTGCLGAAGVAVVAAASGVTVSSLLLHDWYIGVFQVTIVYVSLVATETLLLRALRPDASTPPLNLRLLAGVVLRLALLIGGITWSLAMFVEWGEVSPSGATPPLLFHWGFEHQLLAVTAIVAALFPDQLVGFLRRARSRVPGLAFRGALLAAAISWGIWVPSGLTVLGLGGFLNELFGALGFPASWGAVPPDSASGPQLYFHWAFQHLVLSAFALAVAIAPCWATSPLVWTYSAERPARSTRSAAPGTDRGRWPTPSSTGTRPPSAAGPPERSPWTVAEVTLGRPSPIGSRGREIPEPGRE